MKAAQTRYEVLVETVVSPVALASLHLAVTPTPVPRKTVYRLRVGADRDIAQVVQRLTESGVELLEIRKCPARPERRRRPPGQGCGVGADEDAAPAGVVVPLHAARRAPRLPDVPANSPPGSAG